MAGADSARTEGADPEEADTVGADTEGADPEGADTVGADTEGTDIEGSDTKGATEASRLPAYTKARKDQVQRETPPQRNKTERLEEDN